MEFPSACSSESGPRVDFPPPFLSRSALLPSLPGLHPHTLPHSAALTMMPIFSSCYVGRCRPVASSVSPPMLLRAWFSSSSSSTPPPESKGYKEYKMPPVNPPEYKMPPVNPPDPENPDPVTLRQQWDNAVRLYSRMYSHAWGTAILAGVTLFGIGWWIKGGNPLSPTGIPKKEEAAD